MDEPSRSWFASNTIGPTCVLPEALTNAKQEAGVSITVCLPARDEAATVGDICASIRHDLMGSSPFVDELIVIDSDSSDDTIGAASAAGARVLRARDIDVGASPASGSGKGEALWKSLAVVTGDIVVWADSDVRNFQSDFVTKLVAPLLTDASTVMTKGYYERPDLSVGGGLQPGGRITEILVRPMFGALHPHLTGFVQPLSGEYAIRRDAAMSIPFATGYAVEAGLLIDVAATFGLQSIVQVDLGSRLHTPRDLLSLGQAAAEITSFLLTRAGVDPAGGGAHKLTQFDQSEWWPSPSSQAVVVRERPPMSRFVQSVSGSVAGTTEGAASTADGLA